MFRDVIERYGLEDKTDAEVVQFMHDQWGMITARSRDEILQEHEIQERILELVDNANEMTRSDVQGVAQAIAMETTA